MKTVRDDLLGAALRELEAPEHRPSFHAELERLLAAEVGRAAPVRKPHTTRRWALGRRRCGDGGRRRGDDRPRAVDRGPWAERANGQRSQVQARMQTALADVETLSGSSSPGAAATRTPTAGIPAGGASSSPTAATSG